MFDIHCHLLPGIDDGATTLEQSLDLARFAVADGITHTVTTPHIQPGVYDNNLATITDAFKLFQAALIDNNIDLHVAMAAEIRLCPEILPMLDHFRCLLVQVVSKPCCWSCPIVMCLRVPIR